LVVNKHDLEDPLNVFGIGISNFRHLLREMRNGFLFITILSIAIISIYGTGDGINWDYAVKTKFGHLSIANLGMDSVKCTMIPFGLKKFDLNCPYGTMDHVKSHHFGINSY